MFSRRPANGLTPATGIAAVPAPMAAAFFVAAGIFRRDGASQLHNAIVKHAAV